VIKISPAKKKTTPEGYEERIRRLKEGLEKAKSLRIQAETRLEELQKQEKELIKQIEEMGVKPEHLEEEIKNCEKQIEELAQQVEEIIPWDIIK